MFLSTVIVLSVVSRKEKGESEKIVVLQFLPKFLHLPQPGGHFNGVIIINIIRLRLISILIKTFIIIIIIIIFAIIINCPPQDLLLDAFHHHEYYCHHYNHIKL